MKVYKGIWRYIKVHEGVWRWMKVYSNVRLLRNFAFNSSLTRSCVHSWCLSTALVAEHQHKIVSCSDTGYSRDPSARVTLYPGTATALDFWKKRVHISAQQESSSEIVLKHQVYMILCELVHGARLRKPRDFIIALQKSHYHATKWFRCLQFRYRCCSRVAIGSRWHFYPFR